MKFISFIFFLPFVFLPEKKSSFAQKYPEAFYNAMVWRSKIESAADSICKSYGQNYKNVLPIALPECARYSLVEDVMESTANEYLYVSFGKAYANFSIGRFQMKPSFIENLEGEVKKNPALSKFNFIIEYNNECDEKKIREQRLNRLESARWQMHYLCCYFTLMELKYSKKNWTGTKEKIETYALAYNRGFWCDEKEIARWKNICSFPSGKVDAINNFSYGEVAIEFFGSDE